MNNSLNKMASCIGGKGNNAYSSTPDIFIYYFTSQGMATGHKISHVNRFTYPLVHQSSLTGRK